MARIALTRRRMLSLLAAAAVTPCFAQSPLGARSWRPATGYLDALPGHLARWSVPAAGLALVEEGRLVWSHVLGRTRADAETPATADTLFEAASLSKPVFAGLVLRLADLGVLDLDRPLARFFKAPWLSEDGRNQRITARHVLTHRSGLPNWRADPGRETLQPSFEPGTQQRYSGEAFFWLQCVVEQITGVSLDANASAQIFQPLAMPDSFFSWRADADQRSVWGHQRHADGPRLAPVQMFREQWRFLQPLAEQWRLPLQAWRWPDALRAWREIPSEQRRPWMQWPGDLCANAAASLRCTVQDYARFVAALMCPKMAHQQRWRETSLNAVFAPHGADSALGSGKSLMWNLERQAHRTLFFHGGNNGNIFRNFVLGDRQTGQAIVLMTNGEGGAEFYREAIPALTGLALAYFKE